MKASKKKKAREEGDPKLEAPGPYETSFGLEALRVGDAKSGLTQVICWDDRGRITEIGLFARGRYTVAMARLVKRITKPKGPGKAKLEAI